MLKRVIVAKYTIRPKFNKKAKRHLIFNLSPQNGYTTTLSRSRKLNNPINPSKKIS